MELEQTPKQKEASQSSGVLLFAYGKQAYIEAAYNLIYTLRKYGYSGSITIYTDNVELCNRFINEVATGVKTKALSEKYFKVDGKIEPCLLKLSMYDLLPYENTLYLDVDTIALNDISGLIESLMGLKHDFYTLMAGTYQPGSGKVWNEMVWANPNDVYEQFGISERLPLYAINSSLIFIKKGAIAKDIFKTAKKLFLKKPLPINKLKFKWGGGQPDELYFNAALSLLEYNPEIDLTQLQREPMFFSVKAGYTYDQIIKQYYLFTYYGGQGHTHNFYVDWADRLLKKLKESEGGRHITFIRRIIMHKHANKR
jgi:hypothetical protein